MKKLIVPLVTVIMAVMIGFSAACDGRINESGNDNDRRQGNFTSALDAYNHGKKYFEETAKHYESTYFGKAEPQGMGSLAGVQTVYTHKYLAQNGDFFYDSANYAGGSLGESFAFVAAKKGTDSDISFKKFDNKTYLKKTGTLLESDYTGLNMDSLSPVTDESFQSTCGFDPFSLLNYVVTKDTITNVEYFNSGDEAGEFAYTFKFLLNYKAHANYKKQVKYFSGRNYGSFSSLSLAFGMDEQGRIVQITTVEKYSVKVGINQEVVVSGTQNINYDKNPTINFEGFTVS